MKVGIVGSGISGLSTALFLSKEHEITIFEKNNYFGGHANTIEINNKTNEKFSVDTGFIVYNEKNYPNFTNLLNFLNVNTNNSDMSFSVSVNKGELEYSGSLQGLFGNYKNLLNKEYLIMLKDIVRFYKYALSYKKKYDNIETLEKFLKRFNFSKYFCNYHLIPMASSIWSSQEKEILKFPINSMLDFYKNHELLSFINRPQWKTISGGSKKYVESLIKKLKINKKNKFYLNKEIHKVVIKNNKRVLLDKKGYEYNFDIIVLANHTDEASEIIKNYDKKVYSLLKKFRYQKNIAFLHTDKTLMPINKKMWSSWNYLTNTSNKKSSVTYWMNKLQDLKTKEEIFVTLNPSKIPKNEKILKVINYHHPIYDHHALNSQKQIEKFQGVNNVFYAGAWNGYGFHEDGVKSALKICDLLNIKIDFQNEPS